MGDQKSRYVKLTKDKEQAPFRDITPGELNQPIDVPQVIYLSTFSFFFFLFIYINKYRVIVYE
jgi:hypothetical protein